jgi:hypothetical protein
MLYSDRYEKQTIETEGQNPVADLKAEIATDKHM